MAHISAERVKDCASAVSTASVDSEDAAEGDVS